ncbi:hypothetical protein ACWD4V_07540 [Streptomyces tsukubensis]|uniref:hypothetical protein n=1 Tax=Streptomyces tsukubensis TaxID=83656 RepID=UPI0036C308FB
MRGPSAVGASEVELLGSGFSGVFYPIKNMVRAQRESGRVLHFDHHALCTATGRTFEYRPIDTSGIIPHRMLPSAS